MPDQLALPFPHTPGYAPSDFLRGPGAEEAMTWLDRAAEWPDGRLALWGAAASGKTHLLRFWAARAGAALHDGARLDWRAALDRPGPIGVDDADAAPERALLHLLNAAAEQRRAVLLAARPRPRLWPVRLADLASRLRAIADVELKPSGDEWLALLFARLLTERQIAVSPHIQTLLLRRLPRTPTALNEAASLLDSGLLATGGRMTRGLVVSILDKFA